MAQLKAGQSIIVDTSCLIHFEKGKILDLFLLLPYAFSMPDIVFEEECHRFTLDDKDMLHNKGLKICEQPWGAMERSKVYSEEYPHLSSMDRLLVVSAEDTPNCILLTADKKLREVMEKKTLQSAVVSG